jgi:hypothetical protein
MLPCYEGTAWLILDMPCPLGTVAGQKAVWQISARAKPKQRMFAAAFAKGKHCWTISFPPYESNG